jgi:hypothetical protein
LESTGKEGTGKKKLERIKSLEHASFDTPWFHIPGPHTGCVLLMGSELDLKSGISFLISLPLISQKLNLQTDTSYSDEMI